MMGQVCLFRLVPAMDSLGPVMHEFGWASVLITFRRVRPLL